MASGSAAAALKLKSTESGAGRFTDFNLPPLTFYEYLDLLDRLDEVTNPLQIDKLNDEFEHYLNFGGYPEAIFDENIRQNPERFIRSDIIEKVLLRDLPSLYGIQDTQELNRLFTALAYQTGNEISYEELSQSSGVSKVTIKKYIEYLESAFLIKTLQRVDDSGKRFKRTNFLKVYLTNPSMYTALFGLVTQDSEIMGSLTETAGEAATCHAPLVR